MKINKKIGVIVLAILFVASMRADLKQNLTAASNALQKLDVSSARNALIKAQKEATPRSKMLIQSALTLTEEALQKGSAITADDIRPALRALNGALQTVK